MAAMAKQGVLSDYFVGAGVKVLSGTEVDPKVSRGHELQGIESFHQFVGDQKIKDLPINYVWLSDTEAPVRLTSTGTWYNSREKQPSRTPEYRIYYSREAEDVVYRAKAEDTFFLAKPKQGALLVLLCARGSSIERQLLWLFGLKLEDDLFSRVNIREESDRSLDLTTRYILELIDVEVVSTEDDFLGELLRAFGGKFPSTKLFSKFTRDNLPGINCRDDPDKALLAWMDFEERLFMTLEKYIVGERLKAGFMKEGMPDVDSFIAFSLSVQNRRKSRAGSAFGNHIEVLLNEHDVKFKREATTEKRAGPDFLFPGESEYRDQNWPSPRLTMLGAKTSCKDRWRQVLAEADRIEVKHLLTLEPGISVAQTEEMKKEKLQLVVPAALHQTYQPAQQKDLMSVGAFLRLVRDRQQN
jgi:hypothetical protein